MNSLKKAAEYLMYKGPTLNELIFEAENKHAEYIINNLEDGKILKVKSKTSYNLEIIDKYWFNVDGELYKQTLVMRNKEKIVFDKYREAYALLEKIEPKDCMVS
ncbi:hypothetical protein HNR44_002817 [Geomicrobium halophilum]|uniref:Uncharacterized protein n=1 Tax=Geomicrobium halophilum TaxID=549000 RepID=A0A841PPS0_9BACL|nr:hypothetical protein [Geomicrobium halophilum]MBB6450827.1 hypothetical protein [Geomicrobium halophilum]